MPTPANNVTEEQGHGGKTSGTGDEGDEEERCTHHGHSETALGKFSSLAHQKEPAEEEYGEKAIPRPPESHDFARQKPGSKGLLGQWIES